MKQPPEPASSRNRAAPTVRDIVGWIVDTDRRFRAAQMQIDRYGDRF